MLHCIAENSLTLSVVERIGAGDDVVLMSESLWVAFIGHQHNALLQALLQKSCRVFAMKDLVQAFGIDPSRLMPDVEAIDYDALVKLTEHHPQILTWC